MKRLNILSFLLLFVVFIVMSSSSCVQRDTHPANTSAIDEQAHTEINQRHLNEVQPAPTVTWSSERDNLIKLKLLQNDRNINFFMYVFNEGIAEPIGYYQVNKVSSLDSQLTNPEQIIYKYSQNGGYTAAVIPSPSEDGSYGPNGNGMFGFTPEGICIQTNMHYIASTVPLNFPHTVNRLAIITTENAQALLNASLKAMKVPQP